MLTLRLAARLAFSRDPRQRWRQVSVIGASLVATFVLLLGGGALHASFVQEQRHQARSLDVTEDPRDPIAWAWSAPTLRGQQFPVFWLEARPGAPLPPGLSAYPAPGTVVLSPGLVGEGVTAGDLGLRMSRAGAGPGGVVGESGLRTRSEWIAYAAPPAGRTLRGQPATEYAKGFGVPGSTWSSARASYSDPFVPMPAPVDMLIMVSWALVAPAAFLLGAAARASSGLRARRGRTLFRLGIPSSRIRRLLAAESAMLAAAGAVPAWLSWMLAAPRISALPGTATTVLPGTYAAPWWLGVATVLLAVGVVAAGGSWMRIVDPSVRRSGRPPAPWTIVPYLMALAAMGVTSLLPWTSPWRVPLLYAGMLACLAGIPLGLPWVSAGIGSLMTRATRPARWLAGHRLERRATPLSRPAAIAAALVFIAGCGMAMAARTTGGAAGQSSATGQLHGYQIDWRAPHRGDASAVAAAFSDGITLAESDNGWAARSCADLARAAASSGYGGPACSSAGVAEPELRQWLDERLDRPVTVDANAWPTAEAILHLQAVQGTELDATRAMGSVVPAPQVTTLTGASSSAGTTGPWITAAWSGACLLLFLALVRDISDRVVIALEEDAVPARLGISDRMLASVQRWSLIPPIVIAAPFGIASAIAFALVGAELGVTVANVARIAAVGVVGSLLSLGGVVGAFAIHRAVRTRPGGSPSL